MELKAGNYKMGFILSDLRNATSREEVKRIVEDYSFVNHCHYGRELQVIPQLVRLKNGTMYQIVEQECRDRRCMKEGFTIRDWPKWKIENDWHPPKSLESLDALTTVEAIVCDIESLGPAW